MKITDISFHDSEILNVIEDSRNQNLDFLLYFPENWEENIFKEKTLRFYDFVNYEVNEIPFATNPQILGIKDLGETAARRARIEIQTNAGIRFIEFSKFELL